MKIWRFGQIQESYEWPIFIKEKKLAFNWLDSEKDYSKINIRNYRGWTCIKPWVKELRKGDLIFLMSKYQYGGVAVVEDGYKFKKYDLDVEYDILPSIPINFLHSLNKPVYHNLDIPARRPKTFYHVNGVGFNLYMIMEYLKNNFKNVYAHVQEFIKNNKTAEANKISRVCWNTHDWKKPSGREGKDNSQNSYEGVNGFGHEEWIAEKFRIIDGYHYGFLQTLNLKSDLHVDKIFNIDLVAIDREGYFYHVGKINNAICISKEESEEIYKIYKKNLWLKEMQEEIVGVGGEVKEFNNTQVDILFNIKYKIDDIEIYTDDVKRINSKDKNITNHRYKLLEKIENFKYDIVDDDEPGIDTITRTINTTVTFDATHSKIQRAMLRILRNSKFYKSVNKEHNRIDIAAQLHDGSWEYYEIKTYGSAQKCIRYALGQILEYSYWPGREQAEKLIIVSDNMHDDNTLNYISTLRSKFGLPLYYQSFQIPSTLGDQI